MPTPPDQNIPRIRLPVWKWKQPQKGAGQQQPASQAAPPPPAGPQEKVYIVPPFSFSFHFSVAGIDVPLAISSTGVTAKDIPWAKTASKYASYIATAVDALEVGVSAVGIGATADLTKIGAGPLAAVGVGLGVLSTAYTNLADIMGGSTGHVYQGQHYEGFAYGRDSIVADRNFLLGTAATGVGLIPVYGAPAALGAAYVSVSQLDYDLQGLTESGGTETGGRIVFGSWTDGAAWKDVWDSEVRHHWWEPPPPGVP